VLHPYRGWPLADKNSRLGKWLDALESNEATKNTISDDVLYLDSYERYAGGTHLRREHLEAITDLFRLQKIGQIPVRLQEQ
jgi:hypothetical protein